MRKILRTIGAACLFFVFTINVEADLIWESDDLLAPGAIPDLSAASEGWLVQMYSLTGPAPDLSLLRFQEDGTPENGAGDGLLLSGYTSALEAGSLPFPPFITLSFFEQYGDFVNLYNESVYTVILDTDSWANAQAGVNRTFVLDQNVHVFTASDDQVYNVPANNPGGHEWQDVIPEPGTMGLLAAGLFGLFATRRMNII